MSAGAAGVVALALPGGPGFVEALQNVWGSGEAAFVVDPRLPQSEQNRMMRAMAPTAVIESDGQRRSLPNGRPTQAGDALLVPTSGTSGDPKGVVLTHDAVRASAERTNSALGIDRSVDTWLGCLPLAHIGGLSVVTRSLLTETPLVLHDGFDAKAVMQAVRSNGVTRVSLVTRALSQVDPSAFTTVLLGGAAPPPDRPANVIATYGSTETGSGVVYERRALEGVRLRVDNNGELWVHSPTLLRAYRTVNPVDGSVSEEDPKDGAGWYPTGDSGELDAQGVLSVHGRIGDVIVTGGEKVWPSRLEPLLLELDTVREVAVVGRQDAEWGHVVTALVVPADSRNLPELEQLREAAKAALPPWYAPKALKLVESLPRTSLGKIRRSLL